MKPKESQATTVPVMTLEEFPILSDAERADLLREIKQAEADVAAGNFTVYDPKTFKARPHAVRRAGKP
ncbi:MAG: hypothetical protein IT534_09525 [Bauldia sp.]|nr:hypothetical protein [Bauldia sp.]